jgi:hypothetical protein
VRSVLVIGLLWVLMAPDARGSFGSAAACEAAATAWQRQARDGVRWVAQQRQTAQGQDDPAVTLFWRRSARMAEEQAARARGARCVERS